MNLETLKKIISKPQKSSIDSSFGVYYQDKFPIEIYKKRHPGMADAEYKYIEENWINPVKKVVGDAIFETQKIFNDGNFVIETKNEVISDYIKKYDILGFFKNIYWQNIILDSESVLTYHIKYSEFLERAEKIIDGGGGEYMPIRPYIVTSKNLIFKDGNSIAYKVKGDKLHNFVAIGYNEFGKLVYEHYSFGGGEKLKDVQPIIYYEFEGLEEKKYFRNADGIKDIDDNELVIKSYFSPSASILSTIIIDSINLGVTKTGATFPKLVIVAEPCSEGCSGGFKTELNDKGDTCSVPCKKCNGTGADKTINPFAHYHVINGSKQLGREAAPAPHLYYVDPPQGALNATREDIKNNLNIAFDYLGVRYSDTEVRASQTAMAKLIEREDAFGAKKLYSQDVGTTMQWFVNGWSELMFPLESENKINVKVLHNFKAMSTAETNQLFTELLKDNAPQYRLIDVLRDYYNSIGETAKFAIVNKYYLYKSDDIIMKKGSLGYYDKVQIVISDNIMKWVDEVVDMNENQIDSYLKEKATALMNLPIQSDTGIFEG